MNNSECSKLSIEDNFYSEESWNYEIEDVEQATDDGIMKLIENVSEMLEDVDLLPSILRYLSRLAMTYVISTIRNTRRVGSESGEPSPESDEMEQRNILENFDKAVEFKRNVDQLTGRTGEESPRFNRELQMLRFFISDGIFDPCGDEMVYWYLYSLWKEDDEPDLFIATSRTDNQDTDWPLRQCERYCEEQGWAEWTEKEMSELYKVTLTQEGVNRLQKLEKTYRPA